GHDYSRWLQRLPARNRRSADDPPGGQPGCCRRRITRPPRGGGQSLRYSQRGCDHHRSRTGGLVETEHGRLQVPAPHRVPRGAADERDGESLEERTALATRKEGGSNAEPVETMSL